MRLRLRTLVKLIVATYVLFVVILRFLPTGGRALRSGADCAGSIRAVRQERSNPGCIMCSSLMDDARRQTRRSCSLPYDELVRLIEFEGGDAVTISSGGGTRMLVSSRRDSRSCGGLELLREILHEHASAAMPDEHAECELQRQLQRVASELGRSLSPPMGAAGETVPSSGAFTLLQDCTEPPCCPHEMRTLAAENPHAALFVAQDGGRTADAAAANVAESPLNLWSVESVRDIESLEKRRRAARGCGGSCFTLQIAHALQAHPLHSSPIAAPRTLKGATGGSPQRRLQWMSRQELAEAQEAEAAARQGAHSGLLKAARRAAGGHTVVAARDGRAVSGPAARTEPLRFLEDARSRSEARSVTPLPFTPLPWPAAHAAAGAAAAGAVAAGAAAAAALTPPSGAWVDAGAASTADPNADTSAHDDAYADVDADAQRATAHSAALGHLLLAAKRTLLVAPAAEALSAALEHARSRGLPVSLVQRLRELLPYRTAQEMQAWLDASAKAALQADAERRGEHMANERVELKFDRLGGDAQRAAHARGLLLVIVRATEPRALTTGSAHARTGSSAAASAACAPLPQGAVCLAAASAAAAGGMLLTEALKLQLMPRTVCRLRTALAAAPLLTDSRPQTRLWKITGAQLIAASSASRDSSSAGASSRASSSLASTNASAPSRLDTLMPAAADVIEALEAAAAELQRRGLCANPEHPIVVDGPTGTARRVAACAVRSAPRSGAAAATSSSRCASPLVQCADGTCQPTFLHCYRALTSTAHPSSFGMAAELPDLLAHVLPACASPQRRRRLEEALPEAANLLSALASFDAATRELFPQLCPASMLL